MKSRDDDGRLAGRVLAVHALVWVGAGLEQQADHFEIVEVHCPWQCVGALNPGAVAQEQPQPVGVAELGRVIERLVVVRVGPAREQPFGEGEVARMAEGTVERREHVRASGLGGIPVVDVGPGCDKALGAGDLRLRARPLVPAREREVEDRPARAGDLPRHGLRVARQNALDLVAVEQRAGEAEIGAGEAWLGVEQHLRHPVLTMKERHLETLRARGTAHCGHVARELEARPARVAFLARDDPERVHVLQHLKGSERSFDAGMSLRVSSDKCFLKYLCVLAQAVDRSG